MTASNLTTAVRIEHDGWQSGILNAPGLCEQAVASAWTCGLHALAEDHPLLSARDNPVEVSVVLSSDATVRALNHDHRNQDKPTNVLSFPGDLDSLGTHAEVLAGDVILAWETVEREARQSGKPVADHMSHLVVHGVLHLLGYDHEREDTATEMERLETDSLVRLGLPDPYEMDL